MTKQTKLIKFMIIFLILIPIILLCVAVVQTFVLKNNQNKLDNALSTLEQSQTQYDKQQEIYNYKSSEQYKIDYYIHNGYNNENYGDEGDIKVNINN